MILGILHAGIAAARAERRDLMRGVAGEDHAAMHEAVEPPAIEAIDRHPFELEIALAQHLLQTRDDALRLLLRLDIGIGAELQIDAPDIVRLPVHQRRLAGMERRIEPEPPLGREVRRHRTSAIRNLSSKVDARETETQQIAQRRARAVGGDHPVGVELIGPVRRFDA